MLKVAELKVQESSTKRKKCENLEKIPKIFQTPKQKSINFMEEL